MNPSNVQKSFLPNSKDIRYLNRDFSQLKESLINFTKTYYPNTYKDFSPSSPGMMFIEQAAYVGDILGYYTDYAFKEGLIGSATERRNIINLAKYLGYKIKSSHTSTGVVNVFQLCPSATDGVGNYYPDPNYMLSIKENGQFSSNGGSFYILTQGIDFAVNSAISPRIDTVYSRNQDNTPQFFLLQKQGNVMSGQVYTKEVNVSTASPSYTIKLEENNVIEIIDIVDSDNNNWYEVDYLAQEMVPIAVPNDVEYEGSLGQYKDSVPYILKFLKTSKRFTTTIDENNITTIQFGPGIGGLDDEIITFDSNLLGSGLMNMNNYNVPVDPTNFLKNENYGISPFNTTLTVRYLIGGGLQSNCQSDEIRNVVRVEFNNSSEGLLPEQSNLLNTVKNSLIVTNPSPCVGGKDAETDEEIKMNAMALFAAQSRTVTQNDYLARILSMPPKFGTIAKAQVIADSRLKSGGNKILTGVIDSNNSIITTNSQLVRKIAYDSTNPFSINAYILSYDANKRLITSNEALITNLITHLKQSRMITDSINIIDGYIINIGVNFSISVYKGFNKKDVLLSCINAVQDFFNIDNWSFSQPISLSQLNLEIAKINGVQSVANVNIYNKTSLDGDYSSVEYDIDGATKNGIIYPSVDPSCWEVRFPNSDIHGSTL